MLPNPPIKTTPVTSSLVFVVFAEPELDDAKPKLR
jgi:hypothetical protein